MEEKKPDSYVFDRSIKSYPTEIGSQPFKPDEIQLFKIDKSNKLKHHYVSKFEELKNGIDDKAKSYCAFVWVQKKITPQDC